MNTPFNIIMLTSTAGGGHKSAAAALSESIERLYGPNVTITTIDVLKEYAPQPLDKVPEAYRVMIKTPQFWRGFYELGGTTRRAELISKSIALYTRRQSERLLDNHPCDLIISTYHFANAPILDVLQRRKSPIPFINVVTDLITVPPIWFDKRLTLCLVPSPEARRKALEAGLSTNQVEIAGLPVSSQFQPADDKRIFRTKFGWPEDRRVILVMAGSDGIGPLGRIGRALSDLPVTVVIVCGRNERERERLEREKWPENVKVYGFLSEIAEAMKASDVLITKAGPSSIIEALNCHLPIILYSHLPGQEEGNVDFVISRGAGVWAPSMKQLKSTVETWLSEPNLFEHFQRGASGAAQQGASDDITRLLRRYLPKEH